MNAHARKHPTQADLEGDPLLASLSHDLRTPLNSIKSWTHVLESQLRDPDPITRRALDGILTGIEQQVRLLDELPGRSPPKR